MRKIALALILVAFALPASAANWQTNCSNALITAGFCPAGSQGQPVVVVGWGIAPADATRVAAAICGELNYQGAADPDGLTCAQFADRELRRELQRRVKEWEVRQRVAAEEEAAEEEVTPPVADGKSASESRTAPDGEEIAARNQPR